MLKFHVPVLLCSFPISVSQVDKRYENHYDANILISRIVDEFQGELNSRTLKLIYPLKNQEMDKQFVSNLLGNNFIALN